MKNLLLILMLVPGFCYSSDTVSSGLFSKIKRYGVDTTETTEKMISSSADGLVRVKNVSINFSQDSLDFLIDTKNKTGDLIVNTPSFLKRSFSSSVEFVKDLPGVDKVNLNRDEIKISQAEFDNDFNWPNLKETKKLKALIRSLEEAARDKEVIDFFVSSGINSSKALLSFGWEVLTFKCNVCNLFGMTNFIYNQTQIIYNGYKPNRNFKNLWGVLGDTRKPIEADDYWNYSNLVMKLILKVYFKCGIPGVSFSDIASLSDVLGKMGSFTTVGLIESSSKKAGRCVLNGAIKNTMEGLIFEKRDRKVSLKFNPKNLYNIDAMDEVEDLKSCLVKKFTCTGDYKEPNFRNIIYDLSKKYFIAKMSIENPFKK